jgi:hypothetical protein
MVEIDVLRLDGLENFFGWEARGGRPFSPDTKPSFQ